MTERARSRGSGAPTASRKAAVAAARAADEKKAVDVRILDVSRLIVITDCFVICSGASHRQVSTIVDAIDEALGATGLKATRREGERDARWVLLDFGDIVVHVFAAEEREYYELERLWKDAPEIAWSEGTGGGSAASRSISSGGSPGPESAGRRRART